MKLLTGEEVMKTCDAHLTVAGWFIERLMENVATHPFGKRCIPVGLSVRRVSESYLKQTILNAVLSRLNRTLLAKS